MVSVALITELLNTYKLDELRPGWVQALDFLLQSAYKEAFPGSEIRRMTFRQQRHKFVWVSGSAPLQLRK